MFEKAKLSFTNAIVFEKEFKTNIETIFCMVSQIALNGVINIDGSIDIHHGRSLKKYEAWSYIYYLYYHNNSSIEEFVKMKNMKNGKANAVLFYEVVKETVDNKFLEEVDDVPVSMDINTLIFFINTIVHKYGDALVNPVIDYLKVLVEKLLSDDRSLHKIQNISIITGLNTSTSDVKFVTEPANVNASNIKIKFNYA